MQRKNLLRNLGLPRVPLPAGIINVNFCKNPGCSNFGIPAQVENVKRGRGNTSPDGYVVVGGADTAGGTRIPIPGMDEPEKAICYLTDYGDYDEDHLANLFCKASLRGIDRFFMQVRRRISLLERPIGTSSNVGRMWYGYSAYNPAVIVKLLDILRVFYNYTRPGSVELPAI